jgi:hypothetical protein
MDWFTAFVLCGLPPLILAAMFTALAYTARRDPLAPFDAELARAVILAGLIEAADPVGKLLELAEQLPATSGRHPTGPSQEGTR